MVSLEMRRILHGVCAALALAAAAAPVSSFSQLSPSSAVATGDDLSDAGARPPTQAEPPTQTEPSTQAEPSTPAEPLGAIAASAEDRHREIAAHIEQEQSKNGPYSEQLIPSLTALALLYQEEGDRELASAAIEQALQVVRANYGLHSLEQAPLLEQAIRNEELRGDAEAAWDLGQDLLSLVKKNPNDLRTVPILSGVGDKRLDLLDRYYSGEIPPEIILGCYYGANCVAGSRGKVIQSIVREAKSYYTRAIDVLLEAGRYSSDEIDELTEKIVRSSFRYGDYRDVRPVFKRILEYQAANPSSVPPRKRIDSLIRAADWDVVLSDASESFPDYDASLDLYKQAYADLEKEGVEQRSIDEIFSPKIPVVLPTALPNPLVSEQTADSTGYIDVAFEITRRGTGRHVEILDSTSNASRAAQRDLVRQIKVSLFRPRITNGEIADPGRVVFRYYTKE